MSLAFEKFNQQKKKFGAIKELYCKNEMSFDLYYTGSIIKIQFADGKIKRYGQFPRREGMFLSKLTQNVVKQRIDSGKYVPRNTDPMRFRSNTIMYSADSIRKNLFKPCVSVDIVGCYWKTALNLGVIDQKTYEIGMKKDREYKDARVVAIGSLGALTVHEKYLNGKLVSTDKERKFGACARLDVIDHVWAVANWIAQKLGPDFLMFLTDCFYVPEKKQKALCKLIEQEGYSWKVEKCEFGGVKRMYEGKSRTGEHIYTEKVIWYNFNKAKFKLHDFSYLHNKSFPEK